MEFEVLKRNHLKRNILIGVVAVFIISAIVLNFTRAKYRSVATTPLIHSEINYTLPDLNIIGLYVNGEEVQELDSTKNYVLDTSKSTCTYKDGSTIDNLTITYDSNTKGLSITPYTTRGTKCYLYFDEKILLKDAILANATTQLTRDDFSVTVTEETTGTIYYADTKDGRTYYFAGNPTDNWVKFAGFYWRIIRINGDGSIRMIYQGTSANTIGENTQLQTSAFNARPNYDRSEYVGLKYTSGEQHGQTSNSTIMGVLNTFYQENLSSYADDIDTNVGFCSDRNMASGYSWSSQPSSTIYYAAYDRVAKTSSNVNPSFKCSNTSDILKIPIGLITVDETVYAGLASSRGNSSNYLYTGQYYWTMSPFYFNGGDAVAFSVSSIGQLDCWGVNYALGVRPVINLKADTPLTGNGTSANPYRVVGA